VNQDTQFGFPGGGLRAAGLGLLMAAVLGIALLGLWDRVFAHARHEQPIAFSHELHAGQKQIPCEYCHSMARRSPVAGVPPLQTCMGCHQLIAVRKPEIRKLAAYWEQRAPIPWVKIHTLPDFVYFSHKRHVRAGVACQECHGPVETMKVVEMSDRFPKEMGQCLSCHMEVARTHRFGPEVEPSVDCVTCHK